jgi:hypothetical protein
MTTPEVKGTNARRRWYWCQALEGPPRVEDGEPLPEGQDDVIVLHALPGGLGRFKDVAV